MLLPRVGDYKFTRFLAQFAESYRRIGIQRNLVIIHCVMLDVGRNSNGSVFRIFGFRT